MLIKNGKEYYVINAQRLEKDGKTYYDRENRNKSYFYLDFRADMAVHDIEPVLVKQT